MTLNNHCVKNGLTFFICLFLLCFVGAPNLYAQSSDVQALLNRINRLEADLNNVQRKVYQGQDVPAPNFASSSAAPITEGGEAAALLSTRLDTLELEQRSVTGSLEEVHFKLDQMANRLDRLVLDLDFRLSEIERKQSGLPGNADTGLAVGQPDIPIVETDQNAGVVAQGSPSVGTNGSTPQSGSTSAPSLAKGTQILGTLRVPAGSSTLGNDPAVVPDAAVDQNASIAAAPEQPATFASPAEQYNYAISLIRKDDYAAAETAFSDFLEKYGDHALAGNAQYWLGETFYVRGDYPNAASAFLNGYQVYPDNTKAADNLLKLAMTLGRMDQKVEACATFKELDKKFTNLAGRLKRIEIREKQKFGCQ